MTINQLIKKLEKIRDKHGKRMPVVINTQAIKNWNCDDYTHFNINDIAVEYILWAIDDNVILKDGSERYKKVCTIGDL
ncbi:MAG: hypothetical protein GY861_18005 [bacterium]|nr:hypothetical protein [bacterium]